MKKFLAICSVSLLTLPVMAQQDAVTPLSAVLETMSPSEIRSFESSLETGDAISGELTQAVDRASISQALEAGIITQEQAETVGQLLEIVEADSESFDFDLQRLMQEDLASGNLNDAQALIILTAFNSLNSADKDIAGQEDFTPIDDYTQLSPSGQSAIETFLRDALALESVNNPAEMQQLLIANSITNIDHLTLAELAQFAELVIVTRDADDSN